MKQFNFIPKMILLGLSLSACSKKISVTDLSNDYSNNSDANKTASSTSNDANNNEENKALIEQADIVAEIEETKAPVVVSQVPVKKLDVSVQSTERFVFESENSISSIVPKNSEILIIFDDSGSMAGQKLEKAKEAVLKVVDHLRKKGDSLEVRKVTFYPLTTSPTVDFIANDLNKIEAAVRAIKAPGGTPLSQTITNAFNHVKDEKSEVVSDMLYTFIFTDGENDHGENSLLNSLKNAMNLTTSDIYFAQIENDFINRNLFKANALDLEGKETSYPSRLTVSKYSDASGLEAELALMFGTLQERALLANINNIKGAYSTLKNVSTNLSSDLKDILSKVTLLKNLKSEIEETVEEVEQNFAKLSDIEKENATDAFVQKMLEYQSLHRLITQSWVPSIENSLQEAKNLDDDLNEVKSSAKNLVTLEANLNTLLADLKAQDKELPNKFKADLDYIANSSKNYAQFKADFSKIMNSIVEVQNLSESNMTLLTESVKRLNAIPFDLEELIISKIGLDEWQRIIGELAQKQIVFDSKRREIVFYGTHVIGRNYNAKTSPSVFDANLTIRNEGTIIDLSTQKTQGGTIAGSFENNGTVIQATRPVSLSSGRQGTKMLMGTGQWITLDQSTLYKRSIYWMKADIDDDGHFDGYMIINSGPKYKYYYISDETVKYLKHHSGFKGLFFNETTFWNRIGSIGIGSTKNINPDWATKRFSPTKENEKWYESKVDENEAKIFDLVHFKNTQKLVVKSLPKFVVDLIKDEIID